MTEQAPATIGGQGAFEDFLTGGVPIEIPSDGNAPSLPYVVDFQRIQSILQSRGIGSDAVEAVRKYFKTITEGGS